MLFISESGNLPDSVLSFLSLHLVLDLVEAQGSMSVKAVMHA